MTFLCGASTAQEVDIHWDSGKAQSITVPKNFLRHYPGQPDSAFNFRVTLRGESMPLIGKTEWLPDGIRFNPYWAFTPGLTYNIIWNDTVVSDFSIPASGNAPAGVTIYPRADILPENLLKVYLRFSRPMSEGQSHRYVRVLDDLGDTLRGVFLNLSPELWNEERTLLTLWLDPGRIKRELLLNRELGKPLEEGRHYEIVILPGWRDHQGVGIARHFTKRFAATAPDRSSPDTDAWKVSAPKAGGKEPLEVVFDEMIDYALALNAIHVYSDTQEIEGNIVVADNESRWQFTPVSQWEIGRYRLIIENRLEDLAGNNLDRLFDSDLEQHESAVTMKKGDYYLAFSIE